MFFTETQRNSLEPAREGRVLIRLRPAAAGLRRDRSAYELLRRDRSAYELLRRDRWASVKTYGKQPRQRQR